MGIIPAYAGNTSRSCARLGHRRDHPRIRGEHPLTRLGLRKTGGSSPHTRGTLARGDVGVAHSGIIPAYAGNTSSASRGIGHTGDHPRIRGEHRAYLVPRVCHVGSSPHTRGTPKGAAHGTYARGIIPAYAGNTDAQRGAPRWPRDHPRIRGEHMTRARRRRAPAGSSPHTRGTQHDELRERARRGIIPAYAGNTLSDQLLL